jgi:hypothetical protein
MKKTSILDLRPTQFSLGMNEVHYKTEKIQKFSKAELKDYCKNHTIPVVVGPQKEKYLIDHHHFARACWEQEVEEFEIEILEDKGHLSQKEFWTFLESKKWMYLFDQFGQGPHSPDLLPSDVRCMGDDPYRSLAWELIEAGVIEKSKVPFFEFQWATLLRKNLDIPLTSKSNFKEAVEKSKKIALSATASHLPGFKKT